MSESSTARVVERVRQARATGTSLRIRGAGGWLTAGQPVTAGDTLSLGDDTGIVEYVPGDLTLTARAGTRLADLAAAARANGQWLPLDPWGGDAGTLGATLATASAGPHACATGLPRDVVLGMEFVTGTGQVVRSGGRVVKNVAGFDLTRLVVGSWGTIGVITEATLRLRALPDETRSAAIAVDTDAGALNALARRLRALPFTPLAAELLSAPLATQLGLGTAAVLVAGVGGNAKAARAQIALLRELGDLMDVGDDVWTRVRALDSASSASWRCSQLPSQFGDTWAAAARAAEPLGQALLHGSPIRGVVRTVVPFAGTIDPALLARASTEFRGTIALENLPADAWALVRHAPASDGVSRAVREKFDPDGVLNPGILGAQ